MAVGGIPESARLAPILRVEAALHSMAYTKRYRLLKWFAPAKGDYTTAHLIHRAL
jgi:hypothetical protein